MPWTVSDVDRFKRGLSDAQKRRWVRVANDALRRCQSGGGRDCEASAIRQANGVVGNNVDSSTLEEMILWLKNRKDMKAKTSDLTIHKLIANNYEIREEVLEGRKHLVVPVVMMVEGVHSGSHGAILHQAEELSRNTQDWNSIPVTISHPQVDGMNVSARSPEVLEQYSVGRILNARYESGLRAEAWLDEQRLIAISPEAATYIREGRPLDVSVGVFSEDLPVEGEWEGETYVAIASDYHPDHLALLPGEQGACSWRDGCGIRANKEGGTMESLLKTFKELAQKGFSVSPVTNEQGYVEISQLLQSKLDGLDNDMRMHFLREVYDGSFIYEVRNRERGDTTLYRRGYSLSGNAIELADDTTEVRKKVEYVTMKMVRTKPPINNSNTDSDMSEKGKPCCEARVDALIANKATAFTAKDRDWLMDLEEIQVDRLIESVRDGKEPDLQANQKEAIDTFKASLKTIEDFTALMPEEMKAQFEAGVRMYQENRASLVKAITDNSELTEEDLKDAPDTYLEKLKKTVAKAPADYSLAGGGTPPADDDVGILPTGFGLKPNK